jgi:zinc transport system substrate-binding protein
VGGGLVSVEVMVPPGADAHTYEPKPRQMAALARSQVYFTVGVEFEAVWLDKFKAANPRMLVVRTEAEVPRMAMGGGAHDHSHGEDEKAHEEGHKAGEGHEHRAGAHKEDRHQGLDPHIWLSPRLVAIQARAVRDGLVEVDPANQAAYDRNLEAFLKEIEGLDRELKEAFQGLGGHRHLLVFHPAWGYFCRSYGLRQVAIEKEGKKPTAKGLARLIQQAKEEKAKVILVQPQFSDRSAKTVAKAIKGQVVPADPLAQDWAANLRRVAEQVKMALY